jgi:hypothetical protein
LIAARGPPVARHGNSRCPSPIYRSPQVMLTGTELFVKVKELGESSKSDLVRATFT